VIREMAVKAHRMLRARQQAVRLRGDGYRLAHMQMHRARGVRARGVHGGMQRKACRVHRMRALSDHVAVDVDLDEIRRGDFIERETERVDQKAPRLARHARGNVRVDDIIPAVQRDEPIRRGQFDARRGFGGRARRAVLDPA